MSAISASLPRARALSPRILLGAIVVLGAVFQEILARAVATPGLFPDEYLYSQLGRSFAATGHFTVRGVNPHFLPILAPLVNAPLWLVHDVGTAYRLVQVENTILMSLAAIPTYLLARKLGSRTRLALGAAALSVAAPPVMYSGRLLAEPLAYPLFLAALAAAIAVIERPTVRSQLAFLGVAALATLTRIQLAVLPICVALAILVIGLRGRRLQETLRAQRLLLGAVGGVLALGLAILFSRGFGYYHVAPKAKGFTQAGKVAGVDVFIVMITIGGAMAPSAVAGIAQAVARPRSVREQAFGLVTSIFAVALLAQCVLWGDVTFIQERYLIYLTPLLAIGFCLRWSRSDRRALVELGVAAAIAAVASLVPLTGYATDDAPHLPPTLDAVEWLQGWLKSPSGASALVALLATALAAVGATTAALKRGAAITLLVSFAAASTILVLGSTWSSDDSALARRNFMPADRHWIDHAAKGDKTLVVIGKAQTGGTLMNLFWNPSVTHIVRTPNADKVDWLDSPIVDVAANGSLAVAGKPIEGNVTVASDPAALVVLAGAHKLANDGPITVWHTNGPARLGIILYNRMLSGQALQSGAIRVYQHGGWFEMNIGAPIGHVPATVMVGGHGVRKVVHVAPDGSALLRVPLCGKGAWSGAFVASPAQPFHGLWQAPTFENPRFVPDPSACR